MIVKIPESNEGMFMGVFIEELCINPS